MADVNANIGIHIDTSQSLAEIKNLQRQLAQLYTSINKGSAAAAAAQKGLATNLMNTINAGGKFYAQMGTIRTSTESFTHALEKNKLTMREYFRFAGGSTRTFGKLFKSEFDTIGRVAEERVKKMQTQYIKLGRDASGAMKAISVTPTALNMKDYGNQVAVAAQKQALLNQLLKQGSTNLLNFGKNTQWAGRQLMVGFTIPLAYFGTAAAKTFMNLEAQAVKFRRVYGDMFTTTSETNKALADIENLAKEFTRYGVAVSKTMEMAASAAAMGKTGADLTAQVAQATRLAVLGNVEQEEALKTTISLTNAFGVAAADLTSKINFLNAVENQTVVAIEDLTIAIPKAGPVVKQLGGDVEDLAFFLTAMKEGGINASEGANALKSGLASLINPTDKAKEMLMGLGINIDAIVEGNAGNLRETVIDFAQALDTLAPLERSRAIEQLFGKFQFARLSTLFQNVTKDGTQAARVLDLAGRSVEELAILSERELKAVEDAVGTNFRAAVEELKIAIAPIGKEFLKVITPIVKFFGDLFEKFNNLSDGSKKFIVVLTALVGLVGPTLLMTFGLLANGAANIIKLFLLMRQGFLKLTGNTTNLAQQTQYLNSEQMEAAIVAASLNQAHTKLTQQFTLETSAVNNLRNAYISATSAAARFAAANPGMMLPGLSSGGKGAKPKGFASGTTGLPGPKGAGDIIPILGAPGEAIIPADISQDKRFKPLIEALVSGDIKGYENGTTGLTFGGKEYNAKSAPGAKNIRSFLDSLIKNTDGTLTHIDSKTKKSVTFTKERLIEVLDGRYARVAENKFTLSEIKEKLSIGGVKKGSGISSSKGWISTLTKKAGYPNMLTEKQIIEEDFKNKGINPSQDQRRNLFQTQASHLTQEVGPDGKKIFRAANIAPDAGYINNYINTIKNKLGKELLSMSDSQLSKSLNINEKDIPAFRKELKGLVSGKHPKTAESANALKTVAQYQIAKNPRAPGIYQAHAVVAGIGYRMKNNFYKGGLKTIAQLFPNDKRVVAESAKAKSGVVTPTTGAKAPAGVRVGGKPSDSRMVLKTPGELTVTKKSADALKKGRPVAVPGFGRLRLAGFADGDPSGQRPLSQAQIRAAQEGTSLKEAKRRELADRKAAIAAEKQADQTNKTTRETKNMGAKLATGAHVFSGLAVAGSFMGGKVGEVSQKLMPLAIGASTVAMLLPGLKAGILKFGGFLAMNPLAGVAIAAAGLVVAAKVLDEKMKKQARAQSDYIDAISATTEKMKRVGEITGKVGASEIMQRRREGATADKFSTGFDRAGQQFGTSFIESEVGKEILTNFQTNLAKGGSSAVKQIALELSSYVSDGLMTADDANSVARSIGINMSDMAIAANIQGEIRSIIGPDGQDLLTNPLKVRLEIVEESTKSVQDVTKAITKDMKEYNKILNPVTIVKEFGKMRDLAAAGAATGVQALEALQAQRDAQNKMTEDKIKDLEIEKAKTADKKRQAEIESEISTLKEKQTSDDEKLAAQRPKIIKDQLKLFKQVKGEGKIETAFFEGAKQQVRTKFKDDPFTNKFIDFAAGLESKELKVQLLTTVGAGDLSPRAAINFIELFKGDEATLDTVINSKVALENPDKFAQLQNITSGLKGKKAKKVGLEIITSLTAEGQEGSFDDRLAALTMLQKLDSKEINVAVFLEGNADKKLDKLVPLLNEVEKLKGPIDIKVIQKLEKTEGMPDLQGLVDDWEHYKNLPDEIKKTAIQTYIAIYKSIGDKEIASEFLTQTGGSQTASGFLAERTSKETIRGQAAARLNKELYAAGKAANIIPGNEREGEERAGEDTVLDNLLNRLKFIRKASIDAAGGLDELMRITKGKGLTNFGGVMQQLMAGPKGGFNREFISFLEQMDNKTRATYMTVKNGQVILTKQGKALKEAFNEKVIGEYQVANRQALQDTKAQGAALLKLQASGVDSATALEMVADANLAVAINSKKITGKELRQMAKDAQAAKDEVKKLNLEVLNLAEDLKLKVKDAGDAMLAIAKAREAGITDPEILRKISQDQSVINKILSKGINNKTVNSIVESWQALGKLGEGTEELIDPAKAAMDAFEKLRDAANKVFDRQTQEAQNDFENSMKRLAKTVATLPAAFENLTIEDAIEKANEDIETLQAEIEKIEYENIRPIDIKIEANEASINDFKKKLETAASKLKLKDGSLLPDAAYDDIRQTLEDKISATELDLEFNTKYGARFVEQLKDQISKIELDIELNFSRPIAELQEESSDLANDLTLMDKIADQVNSKYDAQAEALQKVSDINQEILDQQKNQLNIADAITKGDASAAARAMQEMRAQAASAAAQRSGGVLEAARQGELGAIRSAGGMTRSQIEERQFKISQQIYNLEEQSEIRQRAILNIQDQIRGIEEIRTQKQREIRDIQDSLNAGDRARDKFIRENILPLENNIKDLQEKRQGFVNDIAVKEAAIAKIQNEILVPLEAEVKKREKILKDRLDAIDAEKLAWDNAQLALQKATGTATEFAGQATTAQKAFEAAKKAYDNINSKDIVVRITEMVTRIVDTVNPGSGSSPFNTAPAAGKMYGGMIKPMMYGGKAKTMSYGGRVGSDFVPAMLTPGEFVVNKGATKAFEPFLNAINESKYPSMIGRNMSLPEYSLSAPVNNNLMPISNNSASITDSSSTVYNYNVGISVNGTNIDPKNIAKEVMNQIKYVDSQRIRTQRA